MMKNMFLGSLLGIAILVCGSVQESAAQEQPPERTPSPERIASACIRSVVVTAQECASENATIARRCVRRIEELLEAGQVDEANALADRCIGRIANQSEECAEQIRQRCRRCMERLLDLDAEELADGVAEACERALMRIRNSRRAAVSAIEEAVAE